MKNTRINLKVISKIAKALGELNDRVVYVGGAIVSLYIIKIEDQQIRILPLAYFLATKFSAYHDRGAKDPRTSKDFEDITYILDNRVDLIEQVLNSPDEVKQYLKLEFKNILKDAGLQEALVGNLFYETQVVRSNRINDKLKAIVAA